MTFITIMTALILGSLALTIKFFKRGGIYNPLEPKDLTELDYMPATAPEKSQVHIATTLDTETLPEANTAPETLLWATPKQAWHSVRVLCDNEGLSYNEKNLICEVIYQESEFKNWAVCRNKDKNGNILSSDWGICQINDYWHTGKSRTFPSAEYVVAHPEEAVLFMLKMYRLGLLKLWVGYSSGAHKKWRPKTSAMWKLSK